MNPRYPFPAAYIMASRPLGVIYTGSTRDLARRAYEHRQGSIPGFSKDYGCTLLVWYERFELVTAAYARELAIKHWLRRWKIELIERDNPEWRDLYAALVWEA